MSENELVSQGLQKVDVVIKERHHPVLLIEVESSNSVKHTVGKLATGVMSQILYLRKCGKFIHTIKGFFIPVNSGFAEEVTGTFKEESLKFIFQRKALRLNEVEQSIVEAWRDQKGLLPLHEKSSITLPLTPDVIRSKFGVNSYQVTSGRSVVIHDPENHFYYKYSMVSLSSQCNLSIESLRPTLSVYPNTPSIEFLSKPFFIYPEMLPPLRKRDVSSNVILIELTKGTIEALLELHRFGYAHNDVRLENICFRVSDKKPVLIDLERRTPESETVILGVYGDSTMYTHPTGERWTQKQLDFRQLSIMITYLRSTDPSIQYHQIKVDDTAHAFLRNMFYQGMLNVVYLA